MNWIVLSLVAAFLWAIVNVIDKIVITREFNYPSLYVIISSCSASMVFIFISALFGSEVLAMPFSSIVLSIIIGLVQGCALLLYFTSISKEEISRIGPLLALVSVFTVLLAAFMFDERFSPIVYIGILLVIGGSFLLSIRSLNPRFWFHSSILILIAATFLFAVRNVLMKYVSPEVDWNVFFWMGLGLLSFSIIMYAVKRQDFRKIPLDAAFHIVMADVIAAIAFTLFALAIIDGPITLVSMIIELQPVMLFLKVLLLRRRYKKEFYEPLTRGILIQKVSAITLIVCGVLLIIAL